MQYVNKNEVNYLVLNINNNSREEFTTYDLVFTHIMSKDVRSYVINTTNPLQYSFNQRYCTITLDLTGANDLTYEGQYQLKIYGDGTDLVYVSMAVANGVAESNPFTEYISNNEVNENYIYIQD